MAGRVWEVGGTGDTWDTWGTGGGDSSGVPWSSPQKSSSPLTGRGVLWGVVGVRVVGGAGSGGGGPVGRGVRGVGVGEGGSCGAGVSSPLVSTPGMSRLPISSSVESSGIWCSWGSKGTKGSKGSIRVGGSRVGWFWVAGPPGEISITSPVVVVQVCT